MEVLLLLVMGAANVACFLIGAKVGQATAKGEDIKVPSITMPSLERENLQEAQREADRVEAILRNIEAYDGTPFGQENVPGR